MGRLAIIANRGAGRGAGIEHSFLARSRLWGRKCEYFLPDSLSELQNICSTLDSSKFDGVVVIGGDGTINQVIRSFPRLPNQIPLYAFPGGTANDLAKELGLKADWNQVQALLDARKVDSVDLISINDIPFVTVGGVGIGATLTSEFNSRRKNSLLIKNFAQALHSQIYTLLSAKTILFGSQHIHRLHIRAPGFDERIRTPAVFFCNQAYLGGDLRVAPFTDNTDRRFNVLIITTCMRARLINSMIQLKAGKLPPDFLIFSTDQLILTDLDRKPIQAFGDGESLCSAKTLEVKIQSKSLLVYRDRKSKKSSASGENL